MPLPIYRLRRWLIVLAVMFIAMIAGMYFYARLRLRDVLKEVPNKIGIDIQQTANGFQISKSDGKRTLFTVQASNLKQFKLDGSAELHHVSIILYGRDSSRFDQIYGDDFSYDKKSGDVTAHGEVQIDLQANSAGPGGADQAAPKELKNPIHLKTKDLVFNQSSGDASTAARVDFRTPQATGWAVGMTYIAKENVLTLASQVHMTMDGEDGVRLFATHGRITRDPRIVVLDHARLERDTGNVQADLATLFLGPDNEVQRVLATGNVNAESANQNGDPIRARADEGEMFLAGKPSLLQRATLTGNVHVERTGPQPMQGDAGRALLTFAGRNQVQKIHATDGVRVAQRGGNMRADPDGSSSPQDFDITAPIIDFFVAEGSRLDHAETSGAAQITIAPSQTATVTNAKDAGQKTVVTAGRFDARFARTTDGRSRLTSMHGAPDAKIVNSTQGVPDRVSASETVDAAFLAEGGIGSLVQQGSVVYNDGLPPDKRTQAWADKARYTPGDHMLVLTGKPRVSDGGMVTTACVIRINRATDDAFADGNVKSTYSELKEQPNGALLASSSPIHVTSATMTAHNSPSVALYQGNARLWQDANIVEAPSIQFDRDRRFLVAQGTAAQPVLTVLVQQKLSQPDSLPKPAPPDQKNHQTDGKAEEKSADSSPIAIRAPRLTYADDERKAHYEGGVTARGTGFTATSNTMDAYLLPRSQTSGNQSLAGPGRLDHLIAQDNVVIVQPNRRAPRSAPALHRLGRQICPHRRAA